MAKALLKKPKKKDKTTSWYKRKADNIFSIFIRTRDADEFGFINCITCFKRMHWKDVDCGHYISRAYIATRFDEQNCHAQCKSCNGFHGGMMDVYALQLIIRYGDGILSSLNTRKQSIIKESKEFYKMIISRYS